MNGGVTRREDGAIEVSGRLTFQTVPEYVPGTSALDGGAGAITIDLRGVTQVDSAGVALLLEWIEHAHAGRRELRFVNLPEQLRHIIRVSGLERAFGLD